MRSGGRRPTWALAVVLVLGGCTSRSGDDPLADTSQVTEVPRPTSAGPTDADPPDPAPPDPAPPDPAPPDPAPPDPAPPDPAPPDPAPPDPAPPAPDEAAVDEAAPEGNSQAAASDGESRMAVACDDVIGDMTEAVISYETLALAEGGGGGNRPATAAEMRAAWHRAQEAAEQMGAGLPSAAQPAMTEITALHDGLATREVLDESDADPWRDAREELQSWCRAHD
jgi:outer membrane biosynthesis protein TonB